MEKELYPRHLLIFLFSLLFVSLTKTMVGQGACINEDCTVTGFGAGDRTLWIPNLPFAIDLLWKFDANGGHLDILPNGKAHLYGNNIGFNNPNNGFYIDLWLTGRMNWSEWSALGRSWKGQASIVGNLYQFWTYYIVDPEMTSSLTGTGDLEGSYLTLTHKPSNYYYGFQMGQAANDQNGEPGMSCWFFYSGTVNGQNVSGNCDINLEGDCVEIPVFDCPDDILTTCENVSDPLSLFGTPVINCTEAYTLTFVDTQTTSGCTTTYTRTWTAVSEFGNTASCTQTITVTDNVAPQITGVPMIIEACNSNIEEEISVTDNCSGNVTVQVVSADTLWMDTDGCVAGQLRTQTPGGWGANPNGNNPGAYLHAHFNQAFPNGITIGCGGNQLVFTSAQSITNFLPSGGTPAPLPSGIWVNPTNYGNTFAGHLLALTISLGFDAYDPNFGQSTGFLGNMFVNNSAYQGMTIAQIVAQANQVIGGCLSGNASSYTGVLSSINENYVDGNQDNGYVTCQAPWDCYALINYGIEATDACGNVATYNGQTIMIDTTAPDLGFLPANLTAACGEIPGPIELIPNDCGEMMMVTDINDQMIGTGCNAQIIRTYTINDFCGNSSSFQQTIDLSDNIAPVLTGLDAVVLADCGSNVEMQVPVVTDNCSEVALTYTETTQPAECGNNILRTWIAIDDCGNTTTFTQNIIQSDQTPPVFLSNFPDLTFYCEETCPVLQPTAVDNCNGSVDIQFSQSTVFGTGPGCYTYVRQWTATDGCGNQSVLTQNVHFIDNIAPVLQNVPADVTAGCFQTYLPANVTATDNCTAQPTVTMTETTIGSGCNAQIIRTWTATDNCGNSSTASQTIQLSDTTPPVFSGSANITLNCGASIPAPSVTDICDPNPTVVMYEDITGTGCNQVISRYWTATDACGNTASFMQTITINDNVPPTFTSVPMNLQLNCGAFPFVENPVVSDNCSSVTIVMNESTTNTGCGIQITRIWTATDACGNTSTAQQTIVIADFTAPVFSNVPANVYLQCGSTVPAPVWPTVTDNCAANPMVNMTETTDNTCAGTFIVNRTWTAVDNCGNTAIATQTVYVQDTTPPVFDQVLTDITAECGNVPAPPTVTATDNCGGEVTISYSQQNAAGGCPNIFRTWTATDGCGNMAMLVQTVFISDTEPPVITGVPDDMQATCSSIPPLPDPQASDNCDNNVAITLTVAIVGTGCEYTIIRTWMASDDCGNTSVVSQSITVTDDAAPVFAYVPADVTVSCSSIPAASYPPAIDDCGGVLTTTHSDQIIGSGCWYQILRTYTVSDLCGNTASATQTITVMDTTPPVPAQVIYNGGVSCNSIPPATAITFTDNCSGATVVNFTEQQLGSGCDYTLIRTWTVIDGCNNTVQYNQLLFVSDSQAPSFSNTPPNVTLPCGSIAPPVQTPTVGDNCSVATLTFAETTSGGNCSNVILRTWTATDACGNSSTYTQTIQFIDNVAPVLLNAPANMMATCESIPTAPALNALDNCSGTTVSFNEWTESGQCPYYIHRVWTATDACGNATTHTQIITVHDLEAPEVLWAPADMTLTCGDEIPMVWPIFTDNCSLVQTVVQDTYCPGICFAVIHRLFTATDACGNAVSHFQYIWLIDEDAPQFDTEFPSAVVIGCNEPMPTDAPAVWDTCSDFEVEYFETIQAGADATQSIVIRTWVATDLCGHQSTFVQTVTFSCSPPIPAMPSAPQVDFDVFNSTGDEFVLRFVSNEDDRVTVKLLDASGSETAIIFSAAVSGGEEYQLRYPKQGLSGGIYLFVLSSDAGLSATDREIVQ